MADPQGYAAFPGLENITSAVYTLQHGVMPGTIQVEAPEQSRPPQMVGDFEFFYGDVGFRLKDVLCDYAEMSRNAGEERMIYYRLLDRRWRWRFPVISGVYNKPKNNADGFADEKASAAGLGSRVDELEYIEETKKTPRELATLCLKALGEEEKNFDVNDLPEDVFPQVNWDLNRADEALQSLCDTLGYRVVMKLDSKIKIELLGKGGKLPEQDAITINKSIDPPEKPDKIKYYGAPKRLQIDFRLEAVGCDLDGTIKPINELSYKPDKGWETFADFHGFASLKDEYFLTANLARQSIWHMYRIVFDKKKFPEEYRDRISRRDHVTLESTQVERLVDSGGVERNRRAEVFGKFFMKHWAKPEFDGNNVGRLEPLERVSREFKTDYEWKAVITNPIIDKEGLSWRLDEHLQMVVFNEPIYKRVVVQDGTTEQHPAELVLRTACTLIDKDTRAPIRYEKTIDLRQKAKNKSSTKKNKIPEIVETHKNEDLVFEEVAKYAEFTYQLKGTESNKEMIDADADYYIGKIVEGLDTPEPVTIEYAGLKKIEPDGAIQSVTYRVGETGCYTVGTQNTDRTPFALSYAEMRHQQRVKFATETVAALQQVAKRIGRRAPRR